jgi:hypothetical protein
MVHVRMVLVSVTCNGEDRLVKCLCVRMSVHSEECALLKGVCVTKGIEEKIVQLGLLCMAR